MAYCRFGSGDVYMYHHVKGFIECCSCSMAPLVVSIYTTGLEEDDPRIKVFGEIEPCEECKGEGCGKCMMSGSMTFNTRTAALKHLLEHREAGHKVPEYAIKILKEEIEDVGEFLEVYCGLQDKIKPAGGEDEHNE